MEDKIIEIQWSHFLLTFKQDSKMRWEGSVVEIQMFDNDTWEYQSNNGSDFTKDIKEARIWFRWSFCWRGVWEGRVYFKDSEYWSEEMKTIPLIWNQVESIMKDKIKSDNPNYGFFDA